MKKIKLHERRHPVIANNDPDDDGNADKRRYRIDGKHHAISGKKRDQFAHQHDNSARDNTAGKQDTLVGRAEKDSANMRHGDTYKSYRTAKGCNAAGQNPGTEKGQQT